MNYRCHRPLYQRLRDPVCRAGKKVLPAHAAGGFAELEGENTRPRWEERGLFVLRGFTHVHFAIFSESHDGGATMAVGVGCKVNEFLADREGGSVRAIQRSAQAVRSKGSPSGPALPRHL